MEVLEVPDRGDGAAGVCVQRWRRVGGEGDPVGLAQRRNAEEAGDPGAACGVGLEYVDGAGLQRAAEVDQLVAVLARGDVHAGGRAVTQ